MDKYIINDDFLYKYMKGAENIILESLPKEEELSYKFSKRFKRKMNKLIRRENRTPFMKSFINHSKKVAVIFLIFVTIAFATTMSVEAYRVKFFEVVIEVWEEFTSMIFKNNKNINDKKLILYPVKILYIFFMGINFIMHKIKLQWCIVWSYLFILLNLVSLFWSSMEYDIFYNLIWILQAILIFSLTTINLNSKDDLEYIMKCFIIGNSVLAIRLIMVTPIQLWGTMRIGSIVGYNPNVIGIQLIFGIISSMYFLITNKPRRKIILILINVLFFALILFSGSRKSLLIGFLVYFLIRNKENTKKIFIFLFLLPLIFAGIGYLIFKVDIFYNVIGNRLETLIDVLKGEADNIRISMIKEGIRLFINKPIFGNGIDAFTRLSGFETYSHNNYIEILVNYGLIGFIIYYSIYFYIIVKLLYKIKFKNSVFYISIVLILLFLDIGVVSFRDLHILLPLSSAYTYSVLPED